MSGFELKVRQSATVRPLHFISWNEILDHPLRRFSRYEPLGHGELLMTKREQISRPRVLLPRSDNH